VERVQQELPDQREKQELQDQPVLTVRHRDKFFISIINPAQILLVMNFWAACQPVLKVMKQ
jgi:hypothetical protein